ncbi:MAG TPA: hypothetical protein PLD12_11950 [Bacteroidales bacterium]|nr:hypothetical protein [Bacteroidales bacterium]HPO66635.1 hypothetical protein [Bacteroidales bacterium]
MKFYDVKRKDAEKLYWFGWLVALALLVFFSWSCEEDKPEEKISIKEITTDIDSATFWYNTHIYIIRKADFTVKASLIIQKGTIIKFDPSIGRSMTVVDSGQIAAQGTTNYPIVFTSLYDDFHGGDNNNDGNATMPHAGDWEGIIIHGKQHCVFGYTLFLYGGNGVLTLDSSSAEVRYCTFAFNKGGNLENYTGALNARKGNYLTRITQSAFYNNEIPVVINTSISIDNTNRFYNPADTSQRNRYNAIFIDATSPVSHAPQWLENRVALIVASPMLQVPEGQSLTLGNYVTLKFIKNSTLWLASGVSSILNLYGPGVQLTSIFDDRLKGDSNADGSATLPAEGDWTLRVDRDTDAVNTANIFYATKLFAP